MQAGPATGVAAPVAPASAPPPPLPSAVEAPKFHVSDNSNILGPFTIEEVNEKLRNRSISTDASILNPSDDSWVIISEFPSVTIPVYHLARGNEKFGPYTYQEVVSNYESGSLNDGDMILDPDTDSWQTIGEWDGVRPKQYHVQHQLGESQGPYTIPQIVELLNNGTLDAADFIRTDDSEWMPMSSCPQLAKVTSPIIEKRKTEQYKAGGWGGGGILFVSLAIIGFIATFFLVVVYLSEVGVALNLYNAIAVITGYILYLSILRKITNRLE